MGVGAGVVCGVERGVESELGVVVPGTSKDCIRAIIPEHLCVRVYVCVRVCACVCACVCVRVCVCECV